MNLDHILDNEISTIKEHYASERPCSRKLQEMASLYIPGGTTRTALAFEPFPFRVVETTPTDLIDVDGFSYIDFCGDHTNGLFGHKCESLISSIINQLNFGWSIGSTHQLEIQAAELICKRFASMEKVRFTNSGTEANLLAISLCMYLSQKEYVLVFKNGFHGSLLNFNVCDGVIKNELNAPFNFILADFNKIDGLEKKFKKYKIGCTIVEPMQGSGGCIPAEDNFLTSLRAFCDTHSTYLIFDEVMTSRLHPNGLQAHYAVKPDITTLGKYLGGGFSFGAFGGSKNIMSHFDGYGMSLRHSGTFNNNIASMSACIDVLTNLYLEVDVISLNKKGDLFRETLQGIFKKNGIPLTLSGFGSMMHFHSPNAKWVKWIFYALLINGIYIAPNGLISLSLEIQQKHMNVFINICERLCYDICKRLCDNK